MNTLFLSSTLLLLQACLIAAFAPIAAIPRPPCKNLGIGPVGTAGPCLNIKAARTGRSLAMISQYEQQQQQQQKEGTNLEYFQDSGWDTFKDGFYDLFDKISSKKSETSMQSNRMSPISLAGHTNANVKANFKAVQFTPRPPTLPPPMHLFNLPEDITGTDARRTIIRVVQETDAGQKIAPGHRLMTLFSHASDAGESSLFSQKIDNASTPTTVSTAAETQTTTVSSLSPEEADAREMDLTSKNPLRRMRAKLLIQSEERQRKRRQAITNIKQRITTIKEMIFAMVDTVENLYAMIMNLPSQLEQNMIETQHAFDDMNAKARTTLTEIQQTPAKVQNAVYHTKRSVEETQRKTMEILGEVQSIPSKVLKTVDDTQKSLEHTMEHVDKFFVKVESFTSSRPVSILIRPKAVVPQPVVLTHVAATAVTTAAAQDTAVAAQDTTAATTAAYMTTVEKISLPNAMGHTGGHKVPKSIADIDLHLHVEVAEALKVAKNALSLRANHISHDDIIEKHAQQKKVTSKSTRTESSKEREIVKN